MKTWIKRSLYGLFGASVLVGGIAACSHRHHGGEMAPWSAQDAAKWRERVVQRASEELQLDQTQQQRLGVLFDTVRQQRQTLIGSTTNPRAELLGLVAADRFDKAKAQALIDDKTNALRAASPPTLAAMAEFYDGLKPAQQQKLRDWLARTGHRWRS